MRGAKTRSGTRATGPMGKMNTATTSTSFRRHKKRPERALEALKQSPTNFMHPSLRKALECVAGMRKPSVVLGSVKQVENAFRLGAIDEKRYKASLSRVTKTASRVDAVRRDRLAILARTHFAPLLPSDAQLKPSQNAGHMVPHPPPYIELVEDLTPDQQAMYLRAFRSADNLDLIEWYARFRLNSVFRSVILFTDRCDLASLAEEAEVLACVGSVQDGCSWLGRAVADLIRSIAALDGSRRPEFLSQLAKCFTRTVRGTLLLAGARIRTRREVRLAFSFRHGEHSCWEGRIRAGLVTFARVGNGWGGGKEDAAPVPI